MTPALYKITGPMGEPLHGGRGDWPLPTGTEPGAWREVDGPVVACVNGLHLTDAAHIAQWLPPGAVVVWRTEYAGEVIPADTKYAAERVRLLPGPIDGDTVRAALSPAPRTGMPMRAALAGMTLPKGHILAERAERARATYDRDMARWRAAQVRAERARARRFAALFPEVAP